MAEPSGGFEPAIDDRRPVQWFLYTGCGLCVAGALVVALKPSGLPPEVRWPAVAATLAVGAFFAGLAVWPGRLAFGHRMLLASVLGMSLIVALAAAGGQGLRTVALGLLPTLVCLVALLAGRAQALATSLLALLGAGSLWWAEEQGLIDSLRAIAGVPRYTALVSHAVVLAGGLACGLLIASAARRWRRALLEREQHLRELLEMAADRYWELDAELRFRRPGLQVPSSAGELPEHFVGRRPWEVGELQLDPVAQQANMQALQRREPFDIVVRSQPSPGRPEEMVAISGRPRHTEDGRFAGYWGVGRNVTAQLRHEQQLAEARDAAEAANRAKSMFLANISHEIRTPLNGLVGLTELARRSDIGESRRRELLDMLADSATALTQVISDLLDLARIEAGRFELRRMDFDLAALLASLRRAYGVLCEAQGLRFQLDAEPGLPAHVHGDPTRLRQVLANYLNNALKFGRRGTVSLVARRCGPDRLRFEVVDEGDGIAEVDLPRLFTPFEQLHSGRDRRSGGSGLGLAICRELALLMDGQVGVASHAGAGSRFWVELPLPEAASAPATPATPVDDGRLAGMSVLLAEDNAVNRMIGEALLAHWRVRVHTVGDGREALQAVEQAAAAGVPFELVLMDIQMPELDGLAATRALRLRWSASELPVVALTASVLEDERRAARDAGMNDFLAKPIDAADLFGLLRRVREARGTPHADRLPSVTAGHALGASRPAGQAQPGVHPPGPPGHHPGR